MKYFYLVLVSVFIPIKADFIDFVTSRFRGFSSYYIALSVNINENNEKAIIKNNDLGVYFYAKCNFENEQYKDTIRKVLESNIVLRIDSTDLTKYRFRIVNFNEQVNVEYLGETTSFIDKYFKKNQYGAIQKGDWTDDEFNKIVFILFQNNVPVYVECETGLLQIIDIDNYKDDY